MTFRTWLSRLAPQSQHRRFASIVLRDPDFNPARFCDGGIALAEHSACDHVFELYEGAWDGYRRAGFAPVEDARDGELRRLLEPTITKLRAERINRAHSAVVREGLV